MVIKRVPWGPPAGGALIVRHETLSSWLAAEWAPSAEGPRWPLWAFVRANQGPIVAKDVAQIEADGPNSDTWHSAGLGVCRGGWSCPIKRGSPQVGAPLGTC